MAKPTDLVVAYKTEDSVSGGTDADTEPFPSPTDAVKDGIGAVGIFFLEGDNTYDKNVGIFRDVNEMYFYDTENPDPAQRRSLTDLVNFAGHRVLDELVHNIAEDSFDEYVFSGNKIQTLTVWTDSGKTTKIRESTFTHVGNKVTQIVTVQFNAAGAAITGETMTEVLTYTGNNVDDITRTMS